MFRGATPRRNFLRRFLYADDDKDAPGLEARVELSGGCIVNLSRTDGKRAETPSPEGEQRFRSLCACSPVGIFLTDTEGRCTYTNPRCQSICGLTLEESLGDRWVRLVHPEDAGEVFAVWTAHAREGREYSQEFRFRDPHGAVRWVHVRTALMFSEAGRLMGHVGTVEDTTGGKETEQALRESESKYRVLMEQGSDGIHTYDFDGNFIDANSKLCEMLGYTREELLRLNVNDLLPPEELATAPLRLEALRAGETVVSERGVRRQDGTILPVEISGKMLPGGILQAFIRDITARKQAEERLRQSEEWLRAIFAASRDGILVEDDERIVYVNRSYTRLFGYDDPEELIGQNVSVVISAGDVKRMLGFGRRRARGELPPSVYEFEGKRKDGTLIDVEASVSTSIVAGHAYITTMIRDIAERKQAQEALQNSEARYRRLFDSNPLPVWVYDLQTLAFLAVNEAAVRHYGYSREEFLAMTIKDIRPPEDITALLGVVEKPGAGLRLPGVCWRHRKKDGTVINVEVTSHSLTFEGKRAGVVLAHDVTARRRAEEALRRAHDELEDKVAARTAELTNINEALQAEIRERARTEGRLRENEQRLTIALQTGKLGSWQLDHATGALYCSDICKANFGLPPEAEFSYTTLFESIHPDDRVRVRQAVERALTERSDYSAEYRCVWPDGGVHWIIARGRGLYAPDGQPLRMVGVTLDITERKQAEEARRRLLRQLVTAQEDERRRISRELHDQMGQHLAAIGLLLSSLKDSCRWEPTANTRLKQLEEVANQLAREVDTLAWELRPTALDDLGLHAALDNYAAKWSERFQVLVDFHSTGLNDRRLPAQIETTIYRIAQEALTNIIRHARAGRVAIILERRGDHVSTIIEDDGCGFDAEALLGAPAGERRMGLLGMQERAALVGGTLNIESTPGAGTTLFVRLPLALDEHGGGAP